MSSFPSSAGQEKAPASAAKYEAGFLSVGGHAVGHFGFKASIRRFRVNEDHVVIVLSLYDTKPRGRTRACLVLVGRVCVPSVMVERAERLALQ